MSNKHFNRKDSYYKMAKNNGYKSRAAYKILEINQKYKIIKDGDNILDVGCSPGGWSQAVLFDKKNVNIWGIDILEMKDALHENFTFILGDITTEDAKSKVLSSLQEKNGDTKFDTVISDAAPNTIGVKSADQANSFELCSKIVEFSTQVLKTGGHLLFKIFDSADKQTLVNSLKKEFATVSTIKPDSSRSTSFEVYVLCQKKL